MSQDPFQLLNEAREARALDEPATQGELLARIDEVAPLSYPDRSSLLDTIEGQFNLKRIKSISASEREYDASIYIEFFDDLPTYAMLDAIVTLAGHKPDELGIESIMTIRMWWD